MPRVIHKHNYIRIIPTLTLLLLLVFLALPSFVYAENKIVDFNVAVEAPVTLSIDVSAATVALSLSAPYQGSAFDSKSVNVTVNGGSSNGYTLTMYSNSVLTRTTADTSGNYPTIATLSTNDCASGCDSTTFTDNSWGYSVGSSTNYLPVASFQDIGGTSSQATNDITTVNLAAKIDATQATGLYTTELNFVAVAKPEYIMQDVETWKGGLVPNSEISVIDNRDRKAYLVTKLQTANGNPRATAEGDGNKYQIWMTQNLDLDLSNSTTLTHANTDLGWTNLDTSATWTPAASANTIAFTGTGNGVVTGWQNSQTLPYSADPGAVYYFSSGSDAADTRFTSIAACIAAGHTREECLHSAAGNYYNFTAAVASNDTSASTANYTQMPNSICPAGWRLPTGLTAANGYSDYNYLLVQNSVAENYVGASQDALYTTGTPSGLNLIRSNPLFFVRSGVIRSGALRDSGTVGYGWSSTFYSAGDGYGLSFTSTNVYPANNHNKDNGFPVRCIAR